MYSAATCPSECFSIFGFSKNPDFLEHKLLERLGIVPHELDFGPCGRLYWYVNYGDVAETETAIALKLGFVRSPDLAPLSAQQLLVHKILSPTSIDAHAMRGNGLVACFDKSEARFSAYRTLLSGPPLYYHVGKDGILCSDRLRYLVDLVDHLELDEAALPQHFLLLGTLGAQTYYRNVQRLRAGEHLHWGWAGCTIQLIKDFRCFRDEPAFGQVDTYSPWLYQRLKELMGAYIGEIQKSGAEFGNLLSGGVDSSLTQLLIKEYLGQARPRSFSFVVHAPSFDREVEYSKLAQSTFDTDHVFVDILPDDYPLLLVRSTEVLGQPVHMAIEPCKLALAEGLAEAPNTPHYFFDSQGTGAFFGSCIARKLKWLELVGQVPGAASVLGGMGQLLKPVTPKSKMLLKAAIILRDPNDLVAPVNTIGISANFDFALRCFGETAVKQVFELRRGEESDYLASPNYQERVHLMDSFLTSNHLVAQSTEFFAANGKGLLYLYLDEDGVRTSFAVRPEQRFIRGFKRVKPILKHMLEQRSTSPAPRLPKLGSSFNPDVCQWMKCGPLHGMVMAIERPGFLSQADLAMLLEGHDYYFLWALLTFDAFSNKFLKR